MLVWKIMKEGNWSDEKRFLPESLVSGGSGGGWGSGGDGGGDNHEVEEYYQRKLVEENPGNPLFLSNYAQFLPKGDFDTVSVWFGKMLSLIVF